MSTDEARWRPDENLHPLDPKVNTQVRASDRAGALIAKAWPKAGRIARVIFDPALMPDMAKRADAAADEFHARCGEYGDMHYFTDDTPYDPHALHEQGVLKVWAVGTNHCDVIRDRWHRPLNYDRREKPVEWFASVYGNRLPDFFDCTRYGGCKGGATCGRECSVQLAKTCGGPTGVMPVDRSPNLVMLFRCCLECENLARGIAANHRKTAIVHARADLPPGAVIVPEPDPDENPDAWA